MHGLILQLKVNDSNGLGLRTDSELAAERALRVAKEESDRKAEEERKKAEEERRKAEEERRKAEKLAREVAEMRAKLEAAGLK